MSYDITKPQPQDSKSMIDWRKFLAAIIRTVVLANIFHHYGPKIHASPRIRGIVR